MQKKCASCHQEFREEDEVQRVPPLEKVRRGQKSGELGVYPSTDKVHPDDQDLLHNKHGCYEKFFSPMDNPFLYDAISNRVYIEREDQIREEVQEEMMNRFDEVKEMISERKFNFCVDCWADLEEDEPPVCLWCKSPDYVWMHQRRQGMMFCCTRCNKYWNDQEEEMDPPR